MGKVKYNLTMQQKHKFWVKFQCQHEEVNLSLTSVLTMTVMLYLKVAWTSGALGHLKVLLFSQHQ